MKLSTLLTGLLLVAACSRTPAPQTQGPDIAVADDQAQDAEVSQSTPLPMDPEVRVGQLDNGLKYFIKKHGVPEQRADLWLAVDAGSVQEDDDQKGLAHFVEHMAFNGTERFEKNTLIDFLERAGMDFGADINAHTSFDETVYKLTVPTDDPALMKMGMDVLEDWAGAISFDPAEVDKERGVVIEEWRLGRGASQRAFDKQWPIFLAGSKYADRKPIGEKEILENAPVETLSRFYRDWYRPDLMAVIVVGDVDVDAIEKDIKARFGDLKNPESPRPREVVPVPLLDETRVAVVADPEASLATVTLAIKGPYKPLATEEDFRTNLIERLFHGMLRARLDEIRRQPDAPFVFSFTSTSDMGKAVDIFRLWAGSKPGKVDETLEVLTTEVERVRQHGFLAAELERQKTEMLRNYQRSLEEKDKVEGRSYTWELVRHFLGDEAMPGRAAELALVEKFLPTIAVDEVNAVAETWTSRKDRVVMASGAERDDMPSQADLLAIVDGVGKQKIEPYAEELDGATLMAETPKPGSVVDKKTIDAVGISVWTLSNGARVVVKPTDFKNDEVLFQAFSPGGHSLVPDRQYHSAEAAAGIVAAGGLGEHDAVTVQKLLAGKVAQVRPWISELEEGFRGNASPKDLETMLQMVHLSFTAPRKDPEAFEAWKSSSAAFVKNRDLNPQRVFFDEFQARANGNHPRRQPTTLETLEKVDLETAWSFYQERFGDAGDFTFVFVGNVDLEALEDLSAKYLASLPSNGRKEKWKDVGVKPPRGVERFTVHKGQDPKSFVFMTFHGKAKWSPEAQDDIEMLSEVLDIRLREVLREEMSGVYGAFTFGNIERRPKQRYEYVVGFGCGPENADALKEAVFEEIANLKKSGIEKDYLDKIREQRRRSLETDLKTNRFWINKLVEYYRFDRDPAKLVDLEKKAIERVDSKNVQSAAKRYLKNQYVDGLLMPAAAQAEADDEPNAKKTQAKTKAKASAG